MMSHSTINLIRRQLFSKPRKSFFIPGSTATFTSKARVPPSTKHEQSRHQSTTAAAATAAVVPPMDFVPFLEPSIANAAHLNRPAQVLQTSQKQSPNLPAPDETLDLDHS
ncbi:hypothetical protein TWF281_005167 [Arthrobotrys megalospora]